MHRRSMETLIRQVLQLPNRPAVMYLHIWVPGHNNGQFWGGTIEDEIEVLVKYYGIRSISMWNAIFDKFIAKKVGYQEADIACNAVHPNYLYYRYMADLMIGFLQDQMGQLLADPVSSEELASLERPIPQPMLPRNSERRVPCLNGGSLKQAALLNKGWRWELHKTPLGSLRYAFVSSTPGDTISFKVDTTRHGHAPEGDRMAEVMLGLRFFRGWSNDGWGSGTLTCEPQCQCDPDQLSFTAAWQWLGSQYRWAFLPVANTRDCIIQISNVSPSGTAANLAIYSITVLPGNRTFGAMMSVYAQNIPDE
eukprot:jgi/Botrbrau1/9085/Bobra.178_2s0017.1